ncbi:MAG TPA: PEGA domain-containing protein [bacterium]|nr:PEGA domain-containing protein [bacterium]
MFNRSLLILFLTLFTLFLSAENVKDKKTVKISVTTAPSGLNVYIDGIFAGKSPLNNFEVLTTAKLLEVTEASSTKVVYSSHLDLKNGKITERTEKGYDLKKKIEKKEPQKKPQKQPQEKTEIKIPGPHKWTGTGFVIAGLLTVGLGSLFDCLAVREFKKYNKMADEYKLMNEMMSGDFNEEEYLEKSDGYHRKGQNYSAARTVLFAAGGASILTGIILILVPEKKKKIELLSVGISPYDNGFFISAGGTF